MKAEQKTESKSGEKDNTEHKTVADFDKKAKAGKEELNKAHGKKAAPSQPKFKVKRRVTLPLLKMVINQVYSIIFLDKMYIGKEIENSKYDEPATLVNVVDVSTGEEKQMIVYSVLGKLLEEEYPDDAYVGKSFRLTKLPKAGKDGREYHPFEMVEVDFED